MRLKELDFDFPEELIAQKPVEPRDACRLMYLPASGGCAHHLFSELPRLLRAGDCLVLNDSRVLPARLEARRSSGGRVEVLFLRPEGTDTGDGGRRWEVLARPSHRLRPGGALLLAGGEELLLEASVGEGRWIVQAPPGRPVIALMEKYGRLPLPPYIKQYPAEPSSYQTVFAHAPGSAAAPTAGLHFTGDSFAVLRQEGVKTAYVTLHVGLDTFQPIREPIVEEHRIHRESFSVTAAALEIIRETRGEGGRIVAVGTTATRVLETLSQWGKLDDDLAGPSVEGETDIFITPGYRFQVVDALLTNFHLPRSSV
ncbi:MAG: tRNA preQ1(34) S-adenosylmethionine ribosyltransferase-isomerase QueA, partial [Desulfobacteraceae bacterium]